MKKLFFLFLSILSFGMLNAQIEVEMTSSTSFEQENISSDGVFFTVHVWVANTSDAPVNIKWTLAPSDGCSNNWQWVGCDINFCYEQGQLSNIDEEGDGLAYSLNQGQGHDFTFKVYPYNTAGCCEIDVLFSTVEEPDVIIDSVEAVMAVNEPDCEGVFIGVEEESFVDVSLFPNPTNGNMQIQSNQTITRVLVFDLVGNLLIDQTSPSLSTLDLTSLSEGIYLVDLMIGDEVVSSHKVVKR